jgi:hypothetical protein
VALDARDAEVVELTRALTARVWVEQAEGALVATEGLDPAAASQRLRVRAGASQRTVADVARQVVQDAQRDRTAVLAAERARSRAAEARAAHAEAALEATQAEADERDGGRKGRPPPPTTGGAEPRRRWLSHAIQEHTASRACSTVAQPTPSLSSRGASGSVAQG